MIYDITGKRGNEMKGEERKGVDCTVPNALLAACHSSRYPGKIRSRSAHLHPGCTASQDSSESGRERPFKRQTSMYLSSGEDLANTCSVGKMESNWAGLSFLKAGPSKDNPPSVSMPHSW